MFRRNPFGADDFGYSYFSGTNKLQTIGEGLTSYSYTYDANGNMLSDQLNRTGSIKYDHRNLMTEIRVIKSEAPSIFEPPVDVLYLTQYRYDEAGNRVRKVRYKYTGSTPDPEFDLSGDAPPWTLQSDEFYVRDVSGKEIAIYSGSSLTQWNIWGLDNIGKINADTTRNYYLKDHLGSIRVVLNSVNSVVSAQDYDAWGYQLENRSYNSSAMKYDFTGKERDDETSYDYFGARYYDSRIGNWTSIDPLFEKHFNFSPYHYSLRNSIKYLDPDGRQIVFNENNEIRNLEVKAIKGFVEPEFRKFIQVNNETNSSTLDTKMLDYAEYKVKHSTATFNRLSEVAHSDEITQLIPVSKETKINYKKPNDDNIRSFSLGEDFSGYTLYLGKHNNAEPTTKLTTSGKNEVFYNLFMKNDIYFSKTIGHEIFIHVYRYLFTDQHEHPQINNDNNEITKETKWLERHVEDIYYKK